MTGGSGLQRTRRRGRRGGAMIDVRGSAIEGQGMYAARPISRGTWIVEYTGERITHAEADRRYRDDGEGRHHTLLFTVNEHICIDATYGGNESRFINHSCQPNCEAVLFKGQIHIAALRDIESGEELTYDYGYKLDGEDLEEAVRRYPCRCGAATCRGTILRIS